MRRGSLHATVTPAGVVMMLAGAVLLFTSTLMPAEAAKRHRAAPQTTTCSNQHHLNDPTTHAQVLDSYSFDIQPAAVSVCDLFPNVKAGDIVTANFSPTAGAAPHLTLVAYLAPTKSSGLPQTMFDCASNFSDGCTQSATNSLTVHVPACGFQIDFIYGAPDTPHLVRSYGQSGVWISGMAGDRGSAPCSGNGGQSSSPSPTPQGGVGGLVDSHPGLPNTGAHGSFPQGLLGVTLLVLGAITVTFGGRRRLDSGG